MKKELLSLLLIFATAIALQAQTTLTGKVVAATGEPLFGATVVIKDKALGAQAEDNGRYTIATIPAGRYTVIASYLGFVTVYKELVIAKTLAGKKIALDFVLKENVENLNEVVVKGTSQITQLETKGFAVSAVAMKEVQLQSIQANEVLDRTSGVRIRQNGGLGSRVRYNINGLSGNAIRVFINGIPIQAYGPSFSLSSIPTNMIERIEVYKGVVPVALAGDALGGAINVVLKENIAANTLSASYSFGSFNTHQAAISGSFYNDKSGFTARASGFYNYSDNNYKVYGNQVYTTAPTTGDITYVTAKRFHDTYSSGGFDVAAGFTNKKWADELMVGVVSSSLDKDIQHGATMESVYGNRTADQQTNLATISFKDRSFLSEKWSLNLFSSYSHLKRHVIDTTAFIYDWDGKRKERFDADGNLIGYYEHASGAEAGYPTLQENIEKVYVGRATSSYRVDQHHKFTANFLHTRFTRDSEDPLRHVDIRNLEDTRFSNRSIVGAGYDFKGLDDKLSASLFYKYFKQGIRIIEYKKENATAAVQLNDVQRDVAANGYGFTLAYELFANVLLMTSAENSFRLPVAHELFGNVAENLEPNYALQPERSKNLNLGITLGSYQFGKHEAKLKINTFIRDTKDKIKRNVREDDTDETTEYINDDSYISKGFDIDVFYSYDEKLDFTGNVSVFNSRFNTQFDETGLQYDWYRDRERNAPFFTANGNLRYKLVHLFQKESNTTFSSNLSYVHWFYRDWESLGGMGKDIIPTQLVFDLGVAYTFPNKKLTLALDVRNILDKQVFDNYALQKPGRAFYAKINYTLF